MSAAIGRKTVPQRERQRPREVFSWWRTPAVKSAGGSYAVAVGAYEIAFSDFRQDLCHAGAIPDKLADGVDLVFTGTVIEVHANGGEFVLAVHAGVIAQFVNHEVNSETA